jgi:large conductance mechanosensitive channel
MNSTNRGFWAEFKNFAVKGNAIELAIAVVIGNAFSGVVNSLVGDIITPVLGLITNHVDFKTLTWSPYPSLVIKYGSFIQALINFLVIALSIFVIFKFISATRKRLWRRGEEEKVPEHEKPAQERLLEEIRDLLRHKGGEPH